MVDDCFLFFEQKTAYEMRISDWSSDVCSSDLTAYGAPQLEAKFFHSLMDIGATTPNAQLNTGATLPGYANFTIRGLGTNSGAPSVEPTVGVFIDGIFIGDRKSTRLNSSH